MLTSNLYVVVVREFIFLYQVEYLNNRCSIRMLISLLEKSSVIETAPLIGPRAGLTLRHIVPSTIGSSTV